MKNKTSFKTLICLGAAVAMVGCSATRYNRSTGQYIDDKATAGRVKAALAKDSLVRAGDIRVQSFRGNVHLTGFVDHPVQKDRAGQITRNVRGVEWFKNDIATKEELPSSIQRMSGQGQQVNEPAGAARESSSDRHSSASGTTSSSSSGWEKGSQVVYDPAAELSSRSSASVGATGTSTRSSGSANVSADSAGSNNDLTQRVNAQLRSDNSSAGQNVRVETEADGKIVLRGTVSSKDEKQMIEDRVKAIEGVNKVDNKLEVKN